MPSLERGPTANDIITAAMSRALVNVGYVLLEKWAILLPSIHLVFACHVTDLLKITDIGSEEISNRPHAMMSSKSQIHMSTNEYTKQAILSGNKYIAAVHNTNIVVVLKL